MKIKLKLGRCASYLVMGFLTLSIGSVPELTWAGPYSNGEFSPKLFRSLTKSKELENSVISPYALSLAFGLAGFGARGKTAKQLGKAQPWTLRPEAFSKLWVANRLWVQRGYPLLNSYVEGSDRNFDVRPWMVDFTKAPDFLMDRINGWVEEKTNNKVKDFINLDSLDVSMKMLLSSVIFFRGDWASSFDRGGAREDDFTISSGKNVKAPFMHISGTFRHKKLNNFQILEIPYSERDLVMDVFLPDSVEGLESVEESISSTGIEPILSEMVPIEASVLLPKFEIGSTMDITEGVKSLGVVDAFDPQLADFTGMTGKQDLYISKLFQKSVIAVSETGTTASGSGTSQLRKPASATASISFYADHPFSFLIWNKVTKVVLFLGHYVKPNAQRAEEHGKQ